MMVVANPSLHRPAGIVVRRRAYERLGGFRTDLPHAADWEMWTRLAANVAPMDRIEVTHTRLVSGCSR